MEEIEPEIEKEENEEEETEEVIIPPELYSSPYSYIRNHYEEMYPCLGNKLWSLLSLVIVSLVMPKIPRGEKLIKNKINVCILGQPGIGKTSMGEEFEKVAYNPLSTERITPARLYFEIMKRAKEEDIPKLSLIVSDVAVIFQDEIMIKMIENLLGEEGVISKANMHNKKDDPRKKVDLVAYLSGTPDLMYNQRIRHGLIFRTLTLILMHTKKQHEKILDYISDNMGQNYKNGDSKPIKAFFNEIWDIQSGNHPKIKPVVSYDISEEIKQDIKKFIKPLVANAFDKYSIPFARTLEETFRLMCASAMLNIFNRKVTDGKIKIEKEDADLAKKIIQRDIVHKVRILQSISQIDYWGINNMADLKEWNEAMNRKGKNISEETGFVMKSIIENKNKLKA